MNDQDRTTADDYDSPWKEAVTGYFPEFMAFFFPAAYAQIDWSSGYDFLDQELQAIVQDAQLGRRLVDKLVRVRLVDGGETWIYVHIEIQGSRQAEFAERIFVYNYRLYDRYRRPIVSLALLTDDDNSWRPHGFGWEVLGCRVGIDFPVVKLLDWAAREEALFEDENPFALVTLAQLRARRSRSDMSKRYIEKLKLIQLLYRRGWDRQRIIDLFTLLDWMMRLPRELERRLWQNIQDIEEEKRMRYVTSIERFALERGMQQGMQLGLAQGIEQGRRHGEAMVLKRLLSHRFGDLSQALIERIDAATIAQIETWFDAAIDAASLSEVFAEEPRAH